MLPSFLLLLFRSCEGPSDGRVLSSKPGAFADGGTQLFRDKKSNFFFKKNAFVYLGN